MLALTLPLTLAASLPIFTSFDADTVGAPPPTGGPHQPTSLSVPAGGYALVRSSVFGSGKLVELYDDDGEYVSVNYAFDKVSMGTVRVEATMLFGNYVTAYTMQTTAEGGAVATRLIANVKGELHAGGTQVGTYLPGAPLRVRVDVHPATATFDVTVDRELDGFTDDAATTGLPFGQGGIFDIGQALFSLNEIGGGAGGHRVSYDDIYVGPVSIGTEYCVTLPNSTGLPGTLDAIGSYLVTHRRLVLEARQLPPDQFGYFLASEAQGIVMPPGSSGNLCLKGNIARYKAQVQSSGPLGAIGLQVDLANVPTTPPSVVLPGSTWNFQAWHRDGATSNFSAPVSILFQ